MNDYCIITINGVNYYFPSNFVQYLTIDGINTSNQNITVYSSLNGYNNTSRYPRITFNSNAYPVYYSTNNTNGQELRSISVEFNNTAKLYRFNKYQNVINIWLLFVISMFMILRGFKK